MNYLVDINFLKVSSRLLDHCGNGPYEIIYGAI